MGQWPKYWPNLRAGLQVKVICNNMQKRNVLAGGEKKLIKVEENVGISRLLASFILKIFQLSMRAFKVLRNKMPQICDIKQ